MLPIRKAALGFCGVSTLALGAGVASLLQPALTAPAPADTLVRVAGASFNSARPGRRPALAGRSAPLGFTPWLAAGALSAQATRPSADVRRVSATMAAAAPAATPIGVQAYRSLVQRVARRYSVEWKLVMAIIATESGGDPNAVSPAGAVGLMQLMPDTAFDLGVNDPRDPEQNVEGAVRYLSALLATFGSIDLTLVAYNAGPGFAQRYRDGAVELGAETRDFLMRVGQFIDPALPQAVQGAGAAAPGVMR